LALTSRTLPDSNCTVLELCKVIPFSSITLSGAKPLITSPLLLNCEALSISKMLPTPEIVTAAALLNSTGPPPVMITEPLPDMVPETTPPPEKVIVPLLVIAPDKVPPLTTSAPPASTIGPTTVPPANTSTTPELRTTMPLLVWPKVTPQT
jgi:hypothetical protein